MLHPQDIQELMHFAEINGFLHREFIDVINEYLTTKEVADAYENNIEEE